MSKCPNFTGFMVGIGEQKTVISRMRCKQWSCAFCADKNRLHWRAHLLDTLNKNQADYWPDWFLVTLTAAGNNRTAYGSASALQGAFNTIAQLFRDQAKKLGAKISYVRVFEAHQDGAIHMHVLLNAPLAGNAWFIPGTPKKHPKHPGKWFREFSDYTASKTGLGWKSEIVRIVPYDGYDPVAVTTRYVTKYLTKEAQAFDLPKGARRIITSRDLALKDHPAVSEYDWTLHTAFTLKDLLHHSSTGRHVIDLDRKLEVTWDDFLDSDYLS